ncbi:hypothetical protein KCU95_g6448, partial [Aureobasidium melanogenum]
MSSNSGAGATAHNDDGKDPMRVAAGLKAALHNPNVSDEAKEIASHHLADITSTSHADDGKDSIRVAAGLKAALHNPNVSDEAKEDVSHHLADITSSSHADTTSTSHADDGKDPTRVAAGLKAALHNPNVSDDTKDHLKERLDDMN